MFKPRASVDLPASNCLAGNTAHRPPHLTRFPTVSVALVYSVVGTWLTHLIGKPLVQLEFRQERYEADFRFALVDIT